MSTHARQAAPSIHAQLIARRDRIEAALEKQSRVSDHIDGIALAVAGLPRVRLTVAQAARVRVIRDELDRRMGA